MGRDPGPPPVPVLLGNACYPALEAQGVPQGHESGSFCRRRSIVQAWRARAKSFFSRVELAQAPNSLAVYYCIDKHAYVFVSGSCAGAVSAFVVASKLRWKAKGEPAKVLPVRLDIP